MIRMMSADLGVVAELHPPALNDSDLGPSVEIKITHGRIAVAAAIRIGIWREIRIRARMIAIAEIPERSETEIDLARLGPDLGGVAEGDIPADDIECTIQIEIGRRRIIASGM